MIRVTPNTEFILINSYFRFTVAAKLRSNVRNAAQNISKVYPINKKRDKRKH